MSASSRYTSAPRGRIYRNLGALDNPLESSVLHRTQLHEIDGALQQGFQLRLEVEVTTQAVALRKRFEFNDNVYVTALDIEIVAQGGSKDFEAPHAMKSAQGRV